MNDLMYGDWVSYTFDLEDGTKEIFGRLHGKIRVSSMPTVRNVGILLPPLDWEMYALLPIVGNNEKRMAIVDAAIKMFGFDESLDVIEMEWGIVPDGRWIPVTKDSIRPLVSESMSEEFVAKGLCPRCGDRGEWRALALLCDYHGRFL